MQTQYRNRSGVQAPIADSDRLRRLIFWVLLFGMTGVLAELLLIEHTESTTMWVPVLVLGAGLVSVLVRLVSPGRVSHRLMTVVMVTFVGSGLLGLWFHFDGNRQFELEIYPSMTGGELIWESLKGATPALAPGTMVLLGLIGLVATLGATPSTTE